MDKAVTRKKLKYPNIIILLIITFFSCIALITINYITIKILFTSRAYVNGESQYAKGQNKASRYLITYLYTGNDKEWKLFNKELKTPLGDQLARVALSENLGDDIATKGFLAGKNKDVDIDDMIWIFKNFKSLPFLKKAIGEWKQADNLINKLKLISIEVHDKIIHNDLDDESKLKFLSEISILSDKLSINEDTFSNTFGDGTREIKNYLIVINIFFILMIISCVSIYYSSTLKKMITSENELKENRAQLHDIIQDLEKTKIELSQEIAQHKKLIGTISHDIKSPLKFLAMTSKHIYEKSENSEDLRFKKSTKSVYLSTLQLYNFIDSLLTYSKIFLKTNFIENSHYSLKPVAQDKLNLFHEIAEASNIILINEIDENVTTKINNEILSIILHNIVDNAIKNTEKGTIRIYTQIVKEKFFIIVEDTGKGFREEDLEYYNQLSNSNSSERLNLRDNGMGLHMVMELINMVNGDLKISSKLGQGSKVKIITDLVNS